TKPVVKSSVKAAIKPAVKPTAKITPQVQGKAVVKPIVKKSIQAAKKKEPELRTRYSDDELEEFRLLIIDKLDAAKKELKYLQDQINRKGDNGTDDTENKFASADDGSSSMEREYLNQMAARQIMYMDHLDKALVRIQNKTYGICRVTGKLIEKERLRSVPHATLSMEAKMSQSH
ncbi:MAG: TraR/DksA C4-type zinc finger protein, partial [Chitinophagales bacterium]